MAVVQYKTPGVYVEELDAFPPSVVGVETAVPAFIGYTEKAEQSGRSVLLRPVRISSMVEYASIFGGPFDYQFTVTPIPVTQADINAATDAEATAQAADDKAKKDRDGLQSPATDADKRAADKAVKDAEENLEAATAQKQSLQKAYDDSDYGKAVKHANDLDTAAKALEAAKKPEADDARKKATTAQQAADAEFKKVRPNASIGGKGLQVSVDTKFSLYNSLRLFYANGGGDCYIVSVGDYGAAGIGANDLSNGLEQIENQVGPTMLVIPEAGALEREQYDTLVRKMLKQCHDKQDRVAILDLWADPKTDFNLKTATEDFRTRSVSGLDNEFLRYGMAYVPALRTSIIDPSELDYSNFTEFTNRQPGVLTWALLAESNRLYPGAPPANTVWTGPMDKAPPGGMKLTSQTQTIGKTFFDQMKDAEDEADQLAREKKRKKINQGLVAQIPALKDLYATMAHILGILPASAAMAGVYTQNDTLRGVWNAPANVGLNAVIGPTVSISDKDQSDLNMPINGLAINAIRDFVGRGTLVWGARTLDGNSNDWRYIQVRRALIYIEQSVEMALNKFVFDPNVAQTWSTVTSMIGSFLRGVWQAGGLMGASPAEAFSVQCGLGSTMTAQDVLEGRMIVQIKLTMVHPAEFIVLTFQQQMLGGGA